jgi:O-antigen/teichoic acid export membrane protein
MAVSGLLTIPVVVHYLSKEQIGLWAVVNAIVSYLLWMDLGVGEATGRKIADAVASGDRGEINRWWTATRAVLVIQGAVMILVGVSLSPVFFGFFDIPAALEGDALVLFLGAVVISGLSMPLRGVPGLLTAQHRAHWSYLGSTVTVWINLGVLVLMLHFGWGLRSYVIALAVNQILLWVYYSVLVRCGNNPPGWDWRGIERKRLGALFSFSVSLSVMGILDGLFRTMPAVILGKMGGLALVPVFTFTSKLPIMLTSLVNRTIWAFYPGLLRLQVTGGREIIVERPKWIGALILPLSTFVAAGVVGFNCVFVDLLAGPGFYAGHLTNAIFAAAIVVEPTTHLFRCLLHLSGSMGKAVFVALANLIGCVILACAGYRFFGMPGLAFACLVVPVVMGLYGYLQGGRRCGFRSGELSLRVAHLTLAVVAVTLVAGRWMDGLSGTGIRIAVLGRTAELPALEVLVASGVAMVLAVAAAWRAFTSFRRLASGKG